MKRIARQIACALPILLAIASVAAAVDADALLKDFDVPAADEAAYPMRNPEVGWLHTYVNLWWIALMILGAMPALYVAAWINHDSALVGLNPLGWNVASMGMLLGGAALYVLAPPYAAAPALMLATLVLVKQYVPARNALVIPERQIFTPTHREVLKRRFLSWFGVQPKGKAEKLAEVAKVQTPVGLLNQAGKIVSPAEALHDERDAMRHVKAFFAEAVERRAREAYVVPESGRYETSFKIDGIVHAGAKFDATIARAIFSATRQMTHAESSDPHFIVHLPTMKRRVVFHASFFGEGASEWLCLKSRDEGEKPLKLAELGLFPRQELPIGELLDRGQGLLVVASPPGMGARTTVYAMLGLLDPFSRSIVTFESPVFGPLASIEQNDLSSSESSLDELLVRKLRADYDVMMFDGLPTPESARVALTARKREQLVVARLEAGEELEVLAKLLKTGADPAAIADGLKGVIVQRVVRRLCESCRVAVAPQADVLQRAGIDPSKVERLWEENASGCAECGGTGYHGRIGVFSAWFPGEESRRLISEKAHVQQIREAMRKEGVLGVQRAGLARVIEGVTSLKELARVLK